MVNIAIDENSRYLYSEDMELMLSALSLLNATTVHKLIYQIYDKDLIIALKNKYYFIFEINQSLEKYFKDGILEFLSNYDFKVFSLNSYKSHVQSCSKKVFIKQFFQLMDTDINEIPEFDDSCQLNSFYLSHDYMFSSYLGFQAFITGTERYIAEFFSLAQELRTNEFLEVFSSGQEKASVFLKSAQKQLKKTEPLEYSQQLMGKTFYNRGPYEKFIFCPSQFVPYRALRVFGVNQVLFSSIRQNPINDERIVEKLKAMGDSTRFKIISILGQKGPVRGMDIAQELSLAPSTVSHHMEQLKKAGLITEEQVKNSKYYGLSHNDINEFIQKLTSTLGN